MKRLLLIACSLLFLNSIVLPAQTYSKDDAETKEIFENMKQWHRQELIDRNLDVIKDFYPSSGGTMFSDDQKIVEWKVDQTTNRISGQFEHGKYTSLNVLSNPSLNKNNSSNTVLVFSTITFEDRSIKNELGNKFSLLLLEIYIKKDGQWDSSTKYAGSINELQHFVSLDKNILY